jgi:ribonuclease HI
MTKVLLRVTKANKRRPKMPKNPKYRYVGICDGGCSNNGQEGAAMYGSCKIFRIPVDLRTQTQTLNDCCQIHHMNRKVFNVREACPCTNNLAEAIALQELVQELSKRECFGQIPVEILMDSEIVINHMTGVYRVNVQHLKKIYSAIKRILAIEATACGLNMWSIFKLSHIPGDTMKAVLGH